ncbi:conjugative transposon protein TraN [Larkinella insperata]|uniref:Conjugative transposon protein TraN n=1 Tax=Larkinella insperata TaxID=332158 RepID=A0ABW3Q6H4_9BACT
MKQLLLFFLLFDVASRASAQIAYARTLDQTAFQSSYNISVTANKTTHLIFTYDIKYADLGSKELVGEAVGNANNVFRIKAAGRSLMESNLTIITADGRLFSFLVNYEESPTVLTYDLTKISAASMAPKSAKVSTGSNARLADQLNGLGELAMASKRRIKHIGTQQQGVNLHLKNILYRDDVMFLVLGLDNDSKMDYDLDFMHVFVSQSKKAGESSTSQDVAVDPIKVFDADVTTVPHRKEITKVIAISRMTLEKDRQLMVQMNEKQGGRMLTLPIGTEELAAARPL